jgi:hypothetical protein
MGQRVGVSAGLTVPAGPVRLRAEQKLAEPDREALLADPLRTMEQYAGREGASPRGCGQPSTKGFMAVERDEGHAGIWSGRGTRGRTLRAAWPSAGGF